MLLIIVLESLAHVQPGVPEIQSGDIVDKIAITGVKSVQDSRDLPILNEDVTQTVVAMHKVTFGRAILQQPAHPSLELYESHC